MEAIEYNNRMKMIELDYENAKRSLIIEFGLSQSKFKIGDIIKDHRFTISVDKITVYKGYGLPQPVYTGRELKKDLTPKHNKSIQSIYGNDGVELIKTLKQ